MSSEKAQEAVDAYKTTFEVAERYRTSPGTVRYWRHIGYGPRGVRVGRRTLYPESEIAAWDAKLREASAK